MEEDKTYLLSNNSTSLSVKDIRKSWLALQKISQQSLGKGNKTGTHFFYSRSLNPDDKRVLLQKEFLATSAVIVGITHKHATLRAVDVKREVHAETSIRWTLRSHLVKLLMGCFWHKQYLCIYVSKEFALPTKKESHLCLPSRLLLQLILNL